MKPLQKIIRRIKEKWSAFLAWARRITRRVGRSKVKASNTINAVTTPSRKVSPPVGYHKASSKNTGIKAFLQKLNKRSTWLIAAAGTAAVVIAVVLGVVLGGNGAQATGTSGKASAEEAAMLSVLQESPAAVSEEALPTPAQSTAALVSNPMSTPIATTAPEVAELIPGCHDTRIIDVQEKLMELGYLGNDEPTDYYGNGTKYALQLFQRSHSLQVDGLLGDQTLTALFSEDAMPYTVKLGDHGTDVKSIQERLKELKYFTGEATGDFGERTETAVKNFQKRNGLSPDGIVGENTREVLYSESARSASGSSSGSSGGSSGSIGSSGSHGGGSTIATWEPDSGKVDAFIAFAKTLLGHTYVLGGKGPDVFDCSGFVYYCLNQSGYSIGYMTSGGWANCSLPKVTSMSDMRRGDIICFKGHVGIYLGNGQMIDASSTQGKVRISTNVLTSSYWKKNFICARRLF